MHTNVQYKMCIMHTHDACKWDIRGDIDYFANFPSATSKDYVNKLLEVYV